MKKMEVLEGPNEQARAKEFLLKRLNSFQIIVFYQKKMIYINKLAKWGGVCGKFNISDEFPFSFFVVPLRFENARTYAHI